MKKVKKLMMELLCFVILFILTGCSNKPAITSETFKSKMESMGYTVQDATNQMAQDEYVKKVYIAMSNNSAYEIKFYELSDNDYASNFFSDNKKAFKISKSSSSKEISNNVGNNEKYSLTTNGRFKCISRIDNTVIYLDVNDKYKTLVENVLKDLGY